MCTYIIITQLVPLYLTSCIIIYATRLYVKYAMETIITTAFGQSAEQSSEVITATNEFITALLDKKNFGVEELIVTLCKYRGLDDAE